MDSRARTSMPASSQQVCPACGKGVDSLRAGHVAVLDGAFRYFCDGKCKAAYVDAQSKRFILDETLTAEPPSVGPSGVRSTSTVEPPVASGSAVRENEDLTPAFPQPFGPRDEQQPVPTEEPEETPPTTLRSKTRSSPDALEYERSTDRVAEESLEPEADEPAVASAPAASNPGKPRAASVGFAEVAAAVGIGAGVLAAVVVLAGESAGVARLPLALVSAIALAASTLGRPRESGSTSAWVVVAPIALGSLLACVAKALHDPRADAYAAFVGLAAAGALVVDVVVTRGRRDVEEARARTVAGLAVTARVVRGDTIVVVDAAQVKPGEQVIVEAGESLGVDGLVAAGEAEVAPWLDSPVVVDRREGDAMVAGAAVVSGRLRINATFSGADRAWLRLHSASARIDAAAPLVVLARRSIERGAPLAGLIVAGATFADNGTWLDAAVAACAAACTFGAAAAMTAAGLCHARGQVAAQRRGIVYKDADAFDTAARSDVAVVCSRGTILLGSPELVAVESITGRPDARENGAEIARVLAVAAGAEASSTHPFAIAIQHAARARNVKPENVRSAIGHSGLGVTALAANGDKVIVGSRAFLLREKVSVAIADARTTELEAQGRSVLLVALGSRLIGLLALQDGLRPGARAAVQRLHDARIEPVLLSGEARDTCETIARALDIEHVRPEILPADRGAEVRALAEGGHVVAALGHASTDDGALGASDVAVAMEAAGAAPGEWSVALASDDVRDASLALTVPRACRERSKAVLVVGACGQVVVLLGLAFGVLPLPLAPVVGVAVAMVALAVAREPARAPQPSR